MRLPLVVVNASMPVSILLCSDRQPRKGVGVLQTMVLGRGFFKL